MILERNHECIMSASWVGRALYRALHGFGYNASMVVTQRPSRPARPSGCKAAWGLSPLTVICYHRREPEPSSTTTFALSWYWFRLFRSPQETPSISCGAQGMPRCTSRSAVIFFSEQHSAGIVSELIYVLRLRSCVPWTEVKICSGGCCRGGICIATENRRLWKVDLDLELGRSLFFSAIEPKVGAEL